MEYGELNITHIPGLRRRVCQVLYDSGIWTIDEFLEFEPEDLQRFKGIKTSAHGLHASARAVKSRRPVWYNPLPEICHQNGCMFDLETDPATGIPWSLGWGNLQGETHIALVSPVAERQTITLSDERVITLVPDTDEAWRVFAEAVIEQNAPIYHWTGFDAGVMKKNAPDDVKSLLLHRMHDLHRSFTQTVKLPLHSTSLKVVSAYFQFRYSGYESWEMAYHDYRSWLINGNLSRLARACAYQREDVEALHVVWNWLMENRNVGLEDCP